MGLSARLLLLLVLGLSIAHADDKAWARDVPEEQRNAANKLFEEANQLYSQMAHSAALEKYEAAIALWDHPMIRFNMAVTLIRLERVLEAADSLDAALRFAAAPFTPELYQQALAYQSLIRGRVATVEVSCTQQGTQLTLDGRPWFACPGKNQRRVLAGEHVLVGEKAGFMTQSHPLMLAGGKSTKLSIELLPIDAAVELEYPSPRWLPWTTAVGGLAIAGGGLAFLLAGKDEMRTFEAEFTKTCPPGCDFREMPPLANVYDRAKLYGGIGAGMMAVGGAAAVGGIVWLIVNRPRRVPSKLEVSPTVGSPGVLVSGSF